MKFRTYEILPGFSAQCDVILGYQPKNAQCAHAFPGSHHSTLHKSAVGYNLTNALWEFVQAVLGEGQIGQTLQSADLVRQTFQTVL